MLSGSLLDRTLGTPSLQRRAAQRCFSAEGQYCAGTPGTLHDMGLTLLYCFLQVHQVVNRGQYTSEAASSQVLFC